MAGLLAADRIIMLEHFLQHIAVANSSLNSMAAMSLHSLMQTNVAHNRGNEHIVMQLAALHKLQSANQHNLVAVHSLAVFVNNQAAVSVAVVSNANMSANLDNLLLQSLQMRRAAAVVDVQTVRLVEDSNNLCAQAAQDNRRNLAVSTIGAVHNDFQAVELCISSAQDMLDIQSGQILFVDNLTNAAAASCLRIINRRSDNSSDFVLYGIRQLMTGLREEFNAIILERIVGCRNNHACVRLYLASEEGNCRSRHYAQKMCVAAGAADACCQSAFQHLTAATGISADNNLRTGNLTTKIFCSCITKLKGQLRIQLHVRYTTNTISTK